MKNTNETNAANYANAVSTISDELRAVLQRVNADSQTAETMTNKEQREAHIAAFIEAANDDSNTEYTLCAASFWKYAASVEYGVTINKRVLMQCGTTEAEWNNLNDTLTLFKYTLTAYLNAVVADSIKNTKSTHKRLFTTRNDAFTVYKAIRKLIQINAPCEHGAIEYLASKVLNAKLANGKDVSSGYKFAPMGNIPALNAIIKYISASANDTVENAVINMERKNKKSIANAINNTFDVDSTTEPTD